MEFNRISHQKAEAGILRMLGLVLKLIVLSSSTSVAVANGVLSLMPTEHPGLAKMPFDVTETITEGDISDRLQQETDYEWSCPDYFMEVVNMPFMVRVEESLFPSELIDCASSWVFIEQGTDNSPIPFVEAICSFDRVSHNTSAIKFAMENIAKFDGYHWKVFRFWSPYTRYFMKSDFVSYANHGLIFGTQNQDFYPGGDDGPQGICLLTQDGVVERIFWPPVLERWQKAEDLGACSDNPQQRYWDITALSFGASNVLWAGIVGGVLRLDFGTGKWKVFDGRNSPIVDHVVKIVPLKKTGKLRIVCREMLPAEPNTFALARIFAVEEETFVEERYAETAMRELNNSPSVIADASGNIYFLGLNSIWRVDGERASEIAPIPSQTCTKLILDSSGHFWTADERNAWLWCGKKWTRFAMREMGVDKTSNSEITAIGEDPLGRIWISWCHPEEWWYRGLGCSILGIEARKALDIAIADDTVQLEK